jgi:DNA-binding CsgD family transcriptional regulator/membrane protein implicated in regulation of membrane protease activity
MAVTDWLLPLLTNPTVVLLLLNLGLLGLAVELLNPGGVVGGAIAVVALLLAMLLLGALPGSAGLVALSPWVLAPIAAAMAGYVAVAARAARRTRGIAPALPPMPQVGFTAIAVTELAPRGVVRVRDEEWSAETAAEPVPVGEKVEVVASEGLRLLVRRVAPAVAAPVVAGMLGDPLTPREREVAALIARGMTNRQIATELVIAETTADRHVSNILGKLELATRSQVAVWAAARRIPTEHAPL